MLAHVVEVTHDKTRGQSAIDLDAWIAASLRAPHNFRTQIRALNTHVPVHKHGEMLKHQHRETVALLPGRTRGAPEAKASLHPASLNQLRQQFGAQQLKRPGVAKKAGFVDRHGLRNRALKCRVSPVSQMVDEFFHTAHALVAQQLGKARFEQVVARRVQHVLREPEDKLAKKAVVGGRCLLRDVSLHYDTPWPETSRSAG